MLPCNDGVRACAVFAQYKTMNLELAQVLYQELMVCDADFVTLYSSCGIIESLWEAMDSNDIDLNLYLSYILLEIVRISPDFSRLIFEHINKIIRLLSIKPLQVPLFQALALAIREIPEISVSLSERNFTIEVCAILDSPADSDRMNSLALMLMSMSMCQQFMCAVDDEYGIWVAISKRMLMQKSSVCQACGIDLFSVLSQLRVTEELFDGETLVRISDIFGAFHCVKEVFRLLTCLCRSAPAFAVTFLEDTTILSSMKRFMSQHERVFEAMPVVTEIALLPNSYAQVVLEYGFLELVMVNYFGSASLSEKRQILRLFCAIGANYVAGISDLMTLNDIIIECIDLIEDLSDKELVVLTLRSIRNLIDAGVDLSDVVAAHDIHDLMDSVIIKAGTDQELAGLASSIINSFE